MHENGKTRRRGSGEHAEPRDLLDLQAAALEAAANPIVISQRDGTIIWVNHAFELLSGYTRAEAIGRNTNLLRSGQQPASFYKQMWETILTGQVWQGEMVNRRKDGSLYHEEMTITPVKGAAEEITHFIAIKLDITQRKLSEERICRLAQVVENSPDMIAIGDPEGRIVFVNPAMRRITGFSEDELVGKPFAGTLLSHNKPPGLDNWRLWHCPRHHRSRKRWRPWGNSQAGLRTISTISSAS